MKNTLFILLALLVTQFSIAQEKEPETLSELLKIYNKLSNVPYISVQELANQKTVTIILDAREINEYNVSHLKDAIYVGHDYFSLDSIQKQLPNKDAKIVVYCSLGIRSETVAEKLKTGNYTNVYNLYGGIFEWKNNDFKVFDSKETATENVHTFNEQWSKWLLKGKKIYPQEKKD